MSIRNANLRAINTFADLIPYLEEELDWPLQQYGFDDLTFEYSPAELGLKDEDAVKIKAIHQLRPLQPNQPWGIFFVEFERKKLPVVVLRRILSHLVIKKRASANRAHAAAWQTSDLLFISAYGEERSDQREIAFAHFHQQGDERAVLRILGWDAGDTLLKLAHVAATLKEKLSWPDDPADAEGWRDDWSGAFRHRIGHVIRTADALAEALAALARRIRDAALLLLAHEAESGALRSLHKAFQTALIHDLSEADFADTYAQTITYGLFTAAISRTEMSDGVHGTALIADNIADIVPVTNPFLKEMLQTFLNVGGRKGGIEFDELGTNDVVELLRGEETDLPAVLRDFGNKTQGEDPVIHFYEHFLAAYDKKLKVQRGVFYTPKPVVGYIVRSVHELLQTEFGLADGLADTTTWAEIARRNPDLTIPEGTDPDSPFVVILDPATGTATFLVEVVEVIYRTLTAKWQKAGLTPAQRQAAWNEYVPQHLLPRLYGYELMMAPYAIAHMKMGLKLYETDYRFASDERVRIYLTNALEPVSDQLSLTGILPALAHEAQAVNEIKRLQRFTVVLGNPPYSLLSSNLQPQHRALVEPYKFINGQHIRERGALQLEKNLNDDYVKFIRMAQLSIEYTQIGILGFITNHSFLDNPTMRGMRWSLISGASTIWVMDLHGNATKQEQPPEGYENENVFQIKQGVAITFFVRLPAALPAAKTYYCEKWGTRISKEIWLLENRIGSHEWQAIHSTPELYLLVPQNIALKTEFETNYKLTDLMPVNGAGYITARDNLVIDFDRTKLLKRIEQFKAANLDNVTLLKMFNVSQKKGWNVTRARRELKQINISEEIIQTNYRPFDTLWIFYDATLVWGRSWPTMRHVIHYQHNLTLLATRLTKDQWDVWVSRLVSSHKAMSAYDTNSIFPLYLIEDPGALQKSLLSHKSANFSEKFLQLLSSSIYSLPANLALPEVIFNYIYAVFRSPSYRLRYQEFLKHDFPRLPITSDPELFRILAELGGELVTLHLVEFALEDEANAPAEWLRYPRLAQFSGGSRVIEKFPAANKAWQAGRVAVNSSSGFTGVPEAVWNFYIGGYQVCHKWLKDRKGRVLSDADIHHYAKIVTALNETIRLMAEIDAVIEEHGGWPIQ